MPRAFHISVGANIALAGIVALLWRAQLAPPSPGAAPSRPETPGAASRTTRAPGREFEPKPGGPKLTPAAVAVLERLGISRDAIAAALIDDETFRHDKAVLALERKYAPRPVPRREMLAASRREQAERLRELKEALGEEGYRSWEKETTMRRINMGGIRMTPQEAETAYRLQKEFNEKTEALRMAKEDGIADEADTDALYNQAKERLDRELAQLLGKDRLTAMRGTPDPVADVCRRYEDLNPTPKQARAVLQVESDLHDQEAALVEELKENPGQNVDFAAELSSMSGAREDRMRRIFGSEAYDAATRQNDPTFQKLEQYAGAWDLGNQQIEPVFQAISAYQDQADRTRMAAEMREAAGRVVNWHEINAGITRARRQTEAALANLIGNERTWRLEQNGLLDVR